MIIRATVRAARLKREAARSATRVSAQPRA